MLIRIQREATKPATIGCLSTYRAFGCDTLERPWAGNQSGISCIPPGQYPVIMPESPRFGRPMMRLGNTDPRRGILIHAANQVGQLQGCIALGKRHGPESLIESRIAVDKLETLVREALDKGEKVWIEILDPVNPKGAV